MKQRVRLIKGSTGRLELVGVPPKLAEHVPGTRVLANSNVAGPPDALSVILQRAGEAPLKPPVVGEEDWGGPEYLRRYQQAGIGWLVDRLGAGGGAILADDMGLGKTLQAILTWEALGAPSVLVACPAATRHGWVKEFRRWVEVEAVLVDSGKKMDALVAPASGPMVVITSYELAGRLPLWVMPGMVIIDEVQNLRGRGAKRARQLLPISNGATYRLGLSGTPMWSRPRDLWMVLRILFPSYRWGKAEEFDLAYCGAFINQWGGRVAKGTTRQDELKHRLQWVQLRRTKEEVLDELPALSRVVRYVEPTAEARRAMRAWAAQQLPLSEALAATLAAKIPEVLATVAEYARPCLIFTWRKDHAREICRRLNAADHPTFLLTGDQSLNERNRTIKSAVDAGASVVATIDAAGVGVDGLQHVSSEGISHALDWVALKMVQMEARLHRIGQQWAVRWTYLVMKGSADQLVEQAVLDKLDTWRKVMGVDAATGGLASALAGSVAPKEQEEAVLRDILEAFREIK